MTASFEEDRFTDSGEKSIVRVFNHSVNQSLFVSSSISIAKEKTLLETYARAHLKSAFSDDFYSCLPISYVVSLL